MMKSSYIEKLLNGVKVEWKKLGGVTNYEQPSKYLVKSKNYNDTFDIPVLTAGKTFILGYTDEKDGIYKASENPAIIFDDFTTANKWVDFDFKVKSSAMKIITSKNESEVLLKYVYYWLNTLPNKLIEGDHKRQWISNFSKKSIPIPPLPVQQEIIRILDTFTKLTAELTAELTARKKQYEYYRDLLLTFDDEVEWRLLSEIADIGTGSSNTNEELETGDYPFFVRSQEVRRKNTYEYDETAIITSGDGVGVGKIFHYVEGKYALHQRAYRIHITDNRVIPKYYFYYMKSAFLPYIKKSSFHSSVTSIRRPMLNNFPVPIPPLEEQERIVSILDKFDALTNSITEGLPQEIELRQKQYEYYRDMLLSFLKEEVKL